MKKIKVVIGANFGDEGKGLMTDYFCYELAEDGHLTNPVLNIRYNGGAQAGHNVRTADGKHHTFSHFGAGSFNQTVATYLAKDFILNPMIFCRELKELSALGIHPVVYVHPDCRITTPYDMLVNQILERVRGKNRHGSCGLGIDETVRRYKKPTLDILGYDLVYAKNCSVLEFSTLMNWYNLSARLRLNEEGVAIDTLTEQEKALLDNEQVFKNYLSQLHEMMAYCKLADDDILQHYSNIVFEGAQGLLLDEDYFPFAPHLTSSKTGSYTPKKMIFEAGLKDEEIEFCYVTRPYFTRHGAGPFPTECDPNVIFGKRKHYESDNVENPYQGAFRYGTFDFSTFYQTITSDNQNMLKFFPYVTKSIAITHLDEISIEPVSLSMMRYYGYDLYKSYGPTREDISDKKKES